MMLYAINNVCLSDTYFVGSEEIEISEYGSSNIDSYMYKSIVVSDNCIDVITPTPQELNSALTIYNALKESASKDVYLLELEQRLTTLELKGRIDINDNI